MNQIRARKLRIQARLQNQSQNSFGSKNTDFGNLTLFRTNSVYGLAVIERTLRPSDSTSSRLELTERGDAADGKRSDACYFEFEIKRRRARRLATAATGEQGLLRAQFAGMPQMYLRQLSSWSCVKLFSRMISCLSWLSVFSTLTFTSRRPFSS